VSGRVSELFSFFFGMRVSVGKGGGGGMNYDRCPAATQARYNSGLCCSDEDSGA
jgi:hypothetical protein